MAGLDEDASRDIEGVLALADRKVKLHDPARKYHPQFGVPPEESSDRFRECVDIVLAVAEMPQRLVELALDLLDGGLDQGQLDFGVDALQVLVEGGLVVDCITFPLTPDLAAMFGLPPAL